MRCPFSCTCTALARLHISAGHSPTSRCVKVWPAQLEQVNPGAQCSGSKCRPPTHDRSTLQRVGHLHGCTMAGWETKANRTLELRALRCVLFAICGSVKAWWWGNATWKQNCPGTPMRPSNLDTYSRGRFQLTCQLWSGRQNSAVVAQVTSCLLWAASRQDACARGAKGPTAQGATPLHASAQSATAGPYCLCGRRPPHITSRKAAGLVMMCSLLRFCRRLKHPVPRPARCFDAQLVRLQGRQPAGISRRRRGAHWEASNVSSTCARNVRAQATEGPAAVEAAGRSYGTAANDSRRPSCCSGWTCPAARWQCRQCCTCSTAGGAVLRDWCCVIQWRTWQ